MASGLRQAVSGVSGHREGSHRSLSQRLKDRPLRPSIPPDCSFTHPKVCSEPCVRAHHFFLLYKNRCLPPKTKPSDPGYIERLPDWWLRGYRFSLGILSPWGFPLALGISKLPLPFQFSTRPKAQDLSYGTCCLGKFREPCFKHSALRTWERPQNFCFLGRGAPATNRDRCTPSEDG